MAFTLMQAHAMVMILAWIFFGSTGILFARYGRSLRLGNRRQLLGKAVWFQIHRLLLSITPLLTLLGFFFILVFAGGTWVDPQVDGLRLFVHSVFGGIIVCCAILQVWLALYRCNPHSRFRYIFDWSHRIIGCLAFGLSTPTLFFGIVMQSNYLTALITLISLWTGWIIIVIIIFEKMESQQRAAVTPVRANVGGHETNRNNTNQNAPLDIESGQNQNVANIHLNLIKLVLFLLHIVISIILSISLIVLICS
jgi:Eukaryotic cytochrome b561